MATKIPQQGKFSIPNNSDRFGNLHYVKNVNFDEEGYIKLSPRSVSLINEGDDSNFDLPLAFGRQQSEYFETVTADNPYEVQINETTLSAVQDTDSDGNGPPQFTFDSHGKYWQNRWYVTEDALLMYKTISNGNWTDTAVALTSGKNHFLEVFKNKNTLCIANGNAVIQVDTNHSTSGGQLVIPADFEIVGLSYNNSKMVVITRLSDTVTGQNQEAILFVWSGASSEAGSGFGVGSDMIMSIAPYKSSFVILTRDGRLRYFNGAGFEDLAALPFYYLGITWGDSQNPKMFGSSIQVDGELIYLNLNNDYAPFGMKGEEYLPETPAGIWCFDPKVGLYHRYSPSLSEVSRLTVTNSNIDTATDILTVTAGTIPATGNPVKYYLSRSTKIGGLKTGEVYYVIKLSSSTMKLATSRQNAIDGIAIDITSTGNTTNYFLALDVTDFGQSYIGRTGAIALAEKQTHLLDNLIFGTELATTASLTTGTSHLNFVIQSFRNIGYIKTPKITSQQIKDSYGKLFINYRPLLEGSKIIVKERHQEVAGLPVTVPQDSLTITWTSPREFYTTADLSEAFSYLTDTNELECEVTGGAGAGQISQIQSMAFDSGTYSVVLKDELEGVSAGLVSAILIENWNLLDEPVTAENQTGTKEIPLDAKSKFSEYKIILDGVDIVIEDILIPNKTYKPIA